MQSALTGGPQLPGVPAWPITAPMCVPMNVTEVGRNLAGTGWPDPPGDSEEAAAGVGTAEDERPAGVPLPPPGLLGAGRGSGGLDIALPSDWPAGWLNRDPATFGVKASPVTSTAAPAADTIARPALRRLACLLTRSKVPGGGGSGWTSASSQESISSRSLFTGIPNGGLQPGTGVMQVRLDRALRATSHSGHFAHPEAGVIVQ